MATTFVTKTPWIWYDIDHIDIFLETSNVRWMKLRKLAFNALWHTVASNDGTNVTNNKSINVLFIFIKVLSLFIHKILCMNIEWFNSRTISFFHFDPSNRICAEDQWDSSFWSENRFFPNSIICHVYQLIMFWFIWDST